MFKVYENHYKDNIFENMIKIKTSTNKKNQFIIFDETLDMDYFRY